MHRFAKLEVLLLCFAGAMVLTGKVAHCDGDGPVWAQRDTMPLEHVREQFADPDMHYAPFIFWFWDEPLQPVKMANMARNMAGQRFNPGYAHPRTTGPGVSPPNPLPPEQWLSPLWFEAFEAALDQAEATGTYLGYCDEYMWPSFQAAGRVVREHPELRARSLYWQTRYVEGGSEVALPTCSFAVAARLASPPPHRDAASEVPLGQWIWKPQPGTGRHTCYLRKSFEVPPDQTIAEAAIRMSVDNRYVLYLNGSRIGACDDWHQIRVWDVSTQVRPGRNVIAVEGGGDGGVDALSLGLRIRTGDGGIIDVVSDASWRVADQAPSAWTDPQFDDSDWANARVVAADPGAEPWNLLDPARQPHVPATIRSDALRILSRGEPGRWQAPQDGSWRVYLFHQRVHGGPNYLDERLADTFISIAHEPYAQTFGEQMGESIPGVFVDNEGDYGHGLAWSETLERRYRRKWGRDIRLWMPLMVDRDTEGQFARARWEWFDVVSDIYAETMGSTSSWLQQRDMYCISNLWEESLQWQAQLVGDFFKVTRAYSMPGNDCLGRKAVRVHDFKEVQSVCAFEGRRFMSEVMGAGGWQHFTPTFLKQAGNAVIAWGVSHVVPHGVFTNRDLDGAHWTPDWYDENPMFPYFHLWADFVRRASYVNAQGHAVPDVLLVNPMDTVWALADYQVFHPAQASGLSSVDDRFGQRVRHINDVYSRAIEELTRQRLEFLIADRHYIRQMRVRPGALVREPFAFRAVVLPPMDVLPLDVASKLLEFAETGGHVYALGDVPSGSTDSGMPDPEMVALMRALQTQASFQECSGVEGLTDAIGRGAEGLVPRIQFQAGEFDMLQRHLRIDGKDVFWLANNDGGWRRCELLVRGVSGGASIWDCESGKIRPVASKQSPAGARLKLQFRPYEAFWLAFDGHEPEVDVSPERETPEAVASLSGPWQVQIDPQVQPNLQHAFEIPERFLQGTERELELWQQWGLEQFSGLVDYHTEFEMAQIHPGRYFLDLGAVLYFAEVWLNGSRAGARLWPPHYLDVTELLREGPNELMVRVGNLVNNNYGDLRASGLLGPVTLFRGEPAPGKVKMPSELSGEPVQLANATADHSQRGFSVTDALIDDETGWGAYDHDIGEPIAQTAVFEAVPDVGVAGQETLLVFTLKHNHSTPSGLSLGRFRLSATADHRDSFADGKANGGDVTADWTVLAPISATSRDGAVLRIQDDGSMLVLRGPLSRDTYRVVCRTELSAITGFRLEALEHPILPRRPGGETEGGPGRSPGEGNFVLTFIRVEASAADDAGN